MSAAVSMTGHVAAALGVSKEAPAAALTFRLSENGVKLLAAFDPAGAKIELDLIAIREALMMQGLSSLFLDEDALARLVKQYGSATVAFTLEIGERQDGECIVKESEDRMTAWLTLTWPHGGEPVSREQINQVLREKGIVSGILTQEIEAALAEGVAVERVIAQGKKPVNGADAVFENLVPEIKERRPQVDENGIADYRNLGELLFVKQGDSLMHRIPGTAGENGQDIHGQVVLARAGKDTPFAPALKGAMPDPADNNLLRAEITGQPVLMPPNGVMVEPTITLPQVNLSTGNVTFDGTINVKGDVKSGMKIHAAGDVVVEGTVESAEIEAGGDVIVKGGVIGSGESRGTAGNAPGAKINCKGTLSARFLENVHAKAEIDILVEEFCMHSELIASNQVVVGKQGTKKGHIRGGRICAANLVRAAVIGTAGGIKTRVQAGFNASIQERLEKTKSDLESNEKEQESLEKLVAFFRLHPERNKGGMMEKAQHTLNKLYADMARLLEVQKSHQAALLLADQARIIVEHSIQGGSEIQIGNKIWRTAEERGAGVFWLKDGELEFGMPAGE